jgi:YggT family protein
VFAILVQVIFSWINPYAPMAPVFNAMTAPFLRPLRRFIPPLGGIDLTPLVLLVIIQIVLIVLANL